MTSTTEDRFSREARHVVGRVLQDRWNDTHPTSRSASYGSDIDVDRAARLLPDLDGQDLFDMMLATTEQAFRDARMQVDSELARLQHEVKRVAERADSLSLHKYAETIYQRRQGAMAEQPKPLDPTPWRGTSHDGYSRRFTGTHSGVDRVFDPRPEFEQDQSKYPGA